jgi:hypothetical protein
MSLTSGYLTVMGVNIAVFWDVTPLSFVLKICVEEPQAIIS